MWAYTLVGIVIGILGLLPFLMVHTQTFLSNVLESLTVEAPRTSGNDFGDRCFSFPVPRWNGFVFFGRVDLDIFVAHSIDRKTNQKRTRKGHNNDQRIAGWITEKGLFKAVFAQHFLRRYIQGAGLLGESYSAS